MGATHEMHVCANCGTRFQDLGPGTRCPNCNARVEHPQRRPEDAPEEQPAGSASAFFYSSGSGWRSMAWQGGGRGVVLALLAAVLCPIFGAAALFSLLVGALFDLDALVTAGLVLMGLSIVSLVFLLWKAIAGLRSASRMMQGSRHGAFDEDRVSGRWERGDSP